MVLSVLGHFDVNIDIKLLIMNVNLIVILKCQECDVVLYKEICKGVSVESNIC